MKQSKEMSLFSENTQAYQDRLHSQASQIRNDQLFACYRDLLLNHTEQYPWLSRVFFLSLLLQESTLIFTNRKGELKDIYLTVCQQLNSKPRLYHCTQSTNVDDIFPNPPTKTPILLFNSLTVDNKFANTLSSHLHTSLVLNIQPLKHKSNNPSFLSEQFHFFIVDEDTQDNFGEFVKHINEKEQKKQFDQNGFAEVVRKNMEMAEAMKEEEGWLRVYLQVLKSVLEDANLMFPNSTWKRLHKGIKIIGMNKVAEKYKMMSLVDCVLAPWFLANTVEQYKVIQTLNDQVIFKIIQVYGAARFSKHLQPHFWISQSRKSSLSQRLQQSSSIPTFFYPCNKFPTNVTLYSQRIGSNSDIHSHHLSYRIKGYDKKLMSDKFIEITENHAYRLEMEIKTTQKMLVYVGLACYDENKKFINTIQICRRKNTEVVFAGLEGDSVLVEEGSAGNLKNWIASDPSSKEIQNFAYLRSIGVYFDGNTDRILPIQNVFYESQSAYQTTPQKGAYRSVSIQFRSILLNPQTTSKLSHLLSKGYLKKGLTVLVNHFEAGAYVIGKVFHQHVADWTKCIMEFQGYSRQPCHNKFLESTKYIRVVVMSNFNSGYPEFHVENKDAELGFGSVGWREL